MTSSKVRDALPRVLADQQVGPTRFRLHHEPLENCREQTQHDATSHASEFRPPNQPRHQQPPTNGRSSWARGGPWIARHTHCVLPRFERRGTTVSVAGSDSALHARKKKRAEHQCKQCCQAKRVCNSE